MHGVGALGYDWVSPWELGLHSCGQSVGYTLPLLKAGISCPGRWDGQTASVAIQGSWNVCVHVFMVSVPADHTMCVFLSPL